MEITHISSHIHIGKEIPMAIAMFLGSGYTTRLLLKVTGV